MRRVLLCRLLVTFVVDAVTSARVVAARVDDFASSIARTGSYLDCHQ